MREGPPRGRGHRKQPPRARLCLCSQVSLSCPQVIFRFALALFKYREEEILRLQDSMSIFKYLRHFTRTVLDARCVLGGGGRGESGSAGPCFPRKGWGQAGDTRWLPVMGRGGGRTEDSLFFLQ